jgi:dihydroxy-acid dehydratase
MTMHSNKFRDPLISRAQPVTIVTPVVEEALRLAGIDPSRDEILDRFMSAQPRIAVVHGAEDHPPSVGSREIVRRLVRHIWTNGALPFKISLSMPCEKLAQGTEGTHYTLLSRNFCAATLATQLEAHGYDVAIVLGVCDKMMVGSLRALIEADLARHRRKVRPLFAALIPTTIGREVFFTDSEWRRFEPLRHRLNEPEAVELEKLFHIPLKPDVYARAKTLLDRCFHRRLVSEGEKEQLERMMAKCTSVSGANCAASEASVIHRMMLASLGLVPRHLDIALKPPADEQLLEVVRRLIEAVQKKERRVSVASLARSNLSNAVAVWSATGTHAGWLLHLIYLANAIGKKLSTTDLSRRTQKIPQILALDDASGNSGYSMALEAESGGNSGIDTIMRTLAERRLIEDRAATLDGPWTQRIVEARSANGNFVYSTMTPFSPVSAVVGIHGNVCLGGMARIGSSKNGKLDAFDKKMYIASYYLGQKELRADLAASDGVLERLKQKVSREALHDTFLFNWRSKAGGTGADLSQWGKNKLWEYLVRENLIRMMIIVAGAGPHASGMPELQLSLNPSSRALNSIAVLVTDGRVGFEYDGICIAHVAPEAFDGGGLAAVRTGDCLYLDLSRGELNVVTPSQGQQGYTIVSAKELLQRPERQRRINELARAREELLPSVRILFDSVSSAEAGVSPVLKA